MRRFSILVIVCIAIVLIIVPTAMAAGKGVAAKAPEMAQGEVYIGAVNPDGTVYKVVFMAQEHWGAVGDRAYRPDKGSWKEGWYNTLLDVWVGTPTEYKITGVVVDLQGKKATFNIDTGNVAVFDGGGRTKYLADDLTLNGQLLTVGGEPQDLSHGDIKIK